MMTRRDALALVLIAAGLPALLYSVVKSPKVALRQLQPRFRKAPLRDVAWPRLASGTYLNEKTGVAHTVAANGGVLGLRRPRRNRKARVTFEWMKRLTPFDLRNIKEAPARIAMSAFRPRADLQGSTAMFEAAALERLRARDHAGACELLVRGIEHTEVLAARKRQPNRSGLRLLDLLAGLAVRYDLRPYAEKAATALSGKSYGGSGSAMAAARLKNWKDPQSKWYRDWQSPQKKWAGLPT